jgi:DNA-binding transcriptional ArsR family regulator
MSSMAVERIPHPDVSEIDLANLLATMGDPIRLEMLRQLKEHGEMTCTQLSDALDLPASTASYHMRLLREAGAVRTRPNGTKRHMSLRTAELESRFPGLIGVLTREPVSV